VQNGNYTDNYTNTKVITIPGASSLSVTITYQTESLSYDWVCVFQGAHSDYTAQTTGYLKKLGGSTKTSETFTVTGDSVTFAFRSDQSNCSYYGYYAVVTGTGTVEHVTTKYKETGLGTPGDLWVGGDLYYGNSLEDAPKVVPTVHFTTNGASFTDGKTYEDVIAAINNGLNVVIIYDGIYYRYLEYKSSYYYFSAPTSNVTPPSLRYIRMSTTGSLNISSSSAGIVGQYSTTSSNKYKVLLTGVVSPGGVSYSTNYCTSIYADCSTGYLYAKSHATSSADYAEYYEWEDGNPNNEDRRGHFVTFAEGNKIRIANNTDDYILGVVSVSPAVLGNDYDSEWCGKYLTDAFGKVLTEEVFVEEYTNEETGEIIPAHMETIPILNPEYDESQEYVSREKRKEWVPVGTHG
jgi:hypothetical protein